MRTCGGILLLALWGSQADAFCNLPRPRLVCAEYFHSKAVVIASIAGMTTVKDSYGDVTGTYYSMTAERSLRGEAPRLFRIYEANDSGCATFDWKRGESYLLFLREKTLNGSWEIDGCGNSGPSQLRQKILQQVETIDTTSNRALIQGVVWDHSIPGPVAGAQIEAHGPEGMNTTETKIDGRFEMHVVPGKYQLRAVSPGKTFEAADITYENPDGLVLENGGCAQVQFIESTTKH